MVKNALKLGHLVDSKHLRENCKSVKLSRSRQKRSKLKVTSVRGKVRSPKGPKVFCFLFLQVSWMRHRDIHLLTVGRYTYTSDQRFSAHHVPMTHFWQLRIRGLTHRDAGKYECQVSTTPPRGHQMYLNVVGKFEEPKTWPNTQNFLKCLRGTN